MATETQISRPAPFVEDIGKDLSKQVLAQTTAVPVVTTGLAGLGTMAQPTKQAFETDEQFKARQGLFEHNKELALGFEQRQQALSGLAPQIAGLDRLQIEAQKRAEAGLGSFQPFLTQAQQLSGAGAGTQDQLLFKHSRLPYQKQVIDESLSEFDRQAAINRQTIRDQAVTAGAFGGGRGVQLAEQGARTAEARGRLQAGLLSDAFRDAVGRRQQAAEIN